jgi:phage tail sheath protein FI
VPTYTAPGVYIEEVVSSQKVLSAAPTAVAAFVGFTQVAPATLDDPEGLAPRLVTSWSQYQDLYGGFVDGYMLPLSVYGYFLNGGSIAYICRVPNNKPAGAPAQLKLPAADKKLLDHPIAITSVQDDANLSISVEQVDGGADAPEGPVPFTINVIEGGKVVETHTPLTLDTVATVVNADSQRVKVAVTLDKKLDLSQLHLVMRAGTFALEKVTPIPVPVKTSSFAGSASARRGIDGLAALEDVTMVIVPDLVTAARKEDGTTDLGMWKAVQTSLIAHCELNGNRMAVLDAPPGMTVQEIGAWRKDEAMYDSAYAALYYPWIKVENKNPDKEGEILIPPSGHIAGLWARTDEERGVWKAPANDTLRGCLNLERAITQTEQGLLNPDGINCIRPFGTRGIRVWGARTLASDSDWRYINVRRLFNMVEATIMEGTQYAVFEPNDVTLWEGVNRTLTGFLRGLWSAGALFGASAEQAFFVKCDAETNPPESIDAGKLVVEVGIAPVKPAEFVVFRISQTKQSAS